MPDLVGARHATVADLATTMVFSQQARDEVVDDRGGRWLLNHDLERTPIEEQHQRALASPGHFLVVGMVEGVVVGHALGEISPAVDAQLCMIEELFVHPGARAIGVGSQMLSVVRDWAVDNGCAAIESQVLPGNRSGKNFFERVGMKTRKMRVSADLP